MVGSRARTRTWLAAAAAVLAAGAVAVGLLTGSSSEPAPARKGVLLVVGGGCGGTTCFVRLHRVRPGRPAARALPGPADEELGGLAFSPDGRTLLSARLRDLGGGRFERGWYVQRPWPGGPLRRVAARRGDAFLAGGTWAPDGRRIAFDAAVADGSRIVVADVATGRTRTLSAGAQPAWSARDRIAYVVARRPQQELGVLRTMRPDGSGVRMVARQGRRPAWSPDGERLAFLGPGSPREGPALYVARADGSAARRIATGAGAPAWSPDGRSIAFVLTGRVPGEDAVVVMDADGGRRSATRLRGVAGEQLYALVWQPS